MHFYEEAHWFQHLTALLLFLAGMFFSFRATLPSWLRVVSSFGLGFLAIDELMMFHECIKMGPLRGLHSVHFRDTMPFIYFLVGVIGLYFTWDHFVRNKVDKIVFISVGVLALINVVSDVFGLLPRSVDVEIEELSEFFIAAFLFTYGLTGLKIKISRDISLSCLVYVVFVISIGLIFFFTRNYICSELRFS